MFARPKLMWAVIGMSGALAHGAVVFHDDFESHDVGDQITTQVPNFGEWGSTSSITPSAHTVQANPLGVGQALRAQRTASSPGFPTARTLTPPEANKVVTVSWDIFRGDRGSSAGVLPFYMGTTFFTDSSISLNLSTEEIRYHNGVANVNTGAFSGHGGWERFEMVVTFGPEENDDGLIHGTFDLFFERLDSNNSRGVLARTQLANDATFYAPGFTSGVGNMRWLYGMNAHQNHTTETPMTSTVYFDNVQVSVAEVPEPVSLGVLGAAGIVHLSVRRRRRPA